MRKSKLTERNWQKDPSFRALCAAFAHCNSAEEAAALFRDVATLSEMQALSERLEVAKQLHRGLTYREVAANTGASTTTVTRVAKCMRDGTGAYSHFLNNTKEEPIPSQNTVLRKYV